jgi:hypothetical protein
MALEGTLRRWVAFLAVTAWSGPALASATFPAVVDQHLKLTGSATIEHAVAPPDGCLLCHMTESGGFGTNNAFGSALRQHGAVGAEPSTVGPALDALEAVDPHAIDDIQMGINPNNDHSDPTESLPTPDYGCSVASARRSGADEWAFAFLSFASVAWLVRGGRRRATRLR